MTELSMKRCVTASNNSGGRPLNLLVHIPKCAGTTVERYVHANFGDRTISPRRRPAPHRFICEPYYAVDFPKCSQRTDFIVGHYFGRSILNHFPDRQARSAVLLRDPVDQIISLYNYRQQRYREAGQRQIPFELWYNSRPYNPLTEFLLLRYLEMSPWRLRCMSPSAVFDTASELLDAFWHVGTHSRCGDLIHRLSEEYGCHDNFTTENVTRERLVTFEVVPPHVQDKLMSETAIDRRLFQRVAGLCPRELGDDTGKVKMLLKDLRRPAAIIAYRAVRAGVFPDFFVATRPKEGPQLRDKRIKATKTILMFVAAMLACLYTAWEQDLVPDKAPFGYADDVVVSIASVMFATIVSVL
jgi:hypothetical protein